MKYGHAGHCSKDGAEVSDSSWTRIRTEEIGDDVEEKIFLMEISERNGLGRVSNIEISDWTSESFSPNHSEIHGYDAEHRIEQVRFCNLQIAGKRMTELAEARIQAGDFTNDITIERDCFQAQPWAAGDSSDRRDRRLSLLKVLSLAHDVGTGAEQR